MSVPSVRILRLRLFMNNLGASSFNSCFTLKHGDCILWIVNVIFQNLRRFPWPRPDLLCKVEFCVADHDKIQIL